MSPLTLTRAVVAATLLAAPASVAAQQEPIPPITEAERKAAFPDGWHRLATDRSVERGDVVHEEPEERVEHPGQPILGTERHLAHVATAEDRLVVARSHEGDLCA